MINIGFFTGVEPFLIVQDNEPVTIDNLNVVIN